MAERVKFRTDVKEAPLKKASEMVLSVKGFNNGCLETRQMNEIYQVKNNHTDLRNISDSLNVRPFNTELPGSWKPTATGMFKEKVINWERI